MITDIATCALVLERWYHRSLRKGCFSRAKALFLVALAVLDAMLPLVVTGKPSLGEAEEICYDWTIERLRSMCFNDHRWSDHRDWDCQGSSVGDRQNNFLLPMHIYKSAAAFMSLFGFLVWLFCGPHLGARAENLDRTRERYITSDFPVALVIFLFLALLRDYVSLLFQFVAISVCGYSQT
jgi:hypothetical protein